MFFRIICFFFVAVVYSQTSTVGLLHLDQEVSEGYTLFTPEVNHNVFLINNCGQVINEWTFSELPGATCYLLENGTLLRAGKKSLEIRDWDNNVLWSYEMGKIGLNQHHDIEPLPNGNILCVVRDTYADSDIIAYGKDPLKVGASIDLDKIVELKPMGTNEAEIVWEWKFIDHLVQDFDETKLNFAPVENHPERIDINYIDPYFEDRDRGFTHVNGIDYNANLDQIIISARHLNEVYIIDHSTTTAEASGHTGGNFNRGGDILWRWGNPMVYKQGGVDDQKLFLQHDAKWVEDGFLDEGKISVFSNGGDGIRTYSSVHLIEPEFSGNFYAMTDNKFAPSDFNWSWSGPVLGRIVYETKKSGAHSLSNGNFIICETSLGQISEIKKSGAVLWTYKNPSGRNILNQFEEPSSYSNAIFRAEKYPSDYMGLIGKDLTPKGIIEDVNALSNRCVTLGTVTKELNDVKILNPIRNNTLMFNKHFQFDIIRIIDLHGKAVFDHQMLSSDHLSLNINPGFYVLELVKKDAVKHIKIIVE